MNILDRDDICIMPWASYILVHDNVCTCCWDASKFSHTFPPYTGPWNGDLMLNNPAFVRQRERMLKEGVKACPNNCHLKSRVVSVKKQFERWSGGKRFENIVADMASKMEDVNAEIYPIIFHVAPALACNQDCIFCMHNEIAKKTGVAKPTKEQVAKILPLYRDVIYFDTCGGDTFSLTDEELSLFYDPMRGCDVTNAVTTNGRGLTLARYDKLVANGPIQQIMLSISSLDTQRYKAIHGRDMAPVIKNIEDITGKYPTHNIIALSCVVLAINLEDIINIVVFAEKHKIPSVYLNVLQYGGLDRNKIDFVDPFGSQYGLEMHEKFLRAKTELLEYQKHGKTRICGFEVFVKTFEDKKAKLLDSK